MHTNLNKQRFKMNKIIFISWLLISLFSCKEKTDTHSSNEYIKEQPEATEKQMVEHKFNDVNGCSQYTNLYEALPHLDTYKDMEFRVLECIHEEQSTTASWTSLNTSYADPKSKNQMEVTFYEIKGKVSEERDVIQLAKTYYNEFTKMPNFYKSGLTFFENASVNILESDTEDNYSKATYLCSYQDKYALLINLEMLGKMNLAKVDLFLKDYLLAINISPTN